MDEETKVCTAGARSKQGLHKCTRRVQWESVQSARCEGVVGRNRACDRAQATQMLTTPCCHVAALATQIKQTVMNHSHARVRRKQCARASLYSCKKGEGTGMIKFQKDRNEFYDIHTECCLRQQ
jgi:hypothetical protein